MPLGYLKGLEQVIPTRNKTRNLQHGKISDSTETPKTLANNTPFLLILRIIRSKTLANSLTVTDNIVSPEVLQILSLFDGISLARESSRGDCGAETGATLV